MSLDDLRPPNSKKARDSSVNTFKRFLQEEDVTLAVVDDAIRSDATGATIIALMDRFGVYLANLKAKDGKGLRRNTVGQYFRQTKIWLLGRFPQMTSLVDGAILAKGRTLERYSGMRRGGRTVKQAPACKKQDLLSLMSYIYATATVAADFQDAALLSLLWYLFGRASDLAMLEKQNVSVCADNVVFIRFQRMKTSEEQGLTIFPDDSPMTCPITALAAALVLQTAPSTALLPHLPQPISSDFALHGPLVPLSAVLVGATTNRSLLDEAVAENERAEADDAQAKETSTSAVPGIHAYVNRVLGRVLQGAQVKSRLSSHSFRRGGAQHANGKPGISPHWIADRGGWNMSTTNKLFSYIFNTTEEDQKIAKILSGHDATDGLVVLDLLSFDATTRLKIDRLKVELFCCCSGLGDSELNITEPVVDVLTAYLLKAFPVFRSLNTGSPLVKRMNQAIAVAGIGLEEMVSWSVHLASIPITAKPATDALDAKHLVMIQHQAAVIDQLIDLSKSLSDRIHKIEKGVSGESVSIQHPFPQNPQAPSPRAPPAKRRKRQNSNLCEAWYEWFARSAHSSEEDKQWKSTLRKCVSYMLLFANALDLDESAPEFRDKVLAVGNQLAAKVDAFFVERSIVARSPGTAEKQFRALHKAGELNVLISDFDARVRTGLVIDPTPSFERSILEQITMVTP